jgi:hypothetical protein
MTRDEKGRFPKGISGNPKGRKPRNDEEDVKALFRRAVSKTDQMEIIERAVYLAKRGDDRARKFIFEYLYGPPKQDIDITSGGESLCVVIRGPQDESQQGDL